MILDIVLLCIIATLGFLYYRQDRIIKKQIDYIESLESNYLDSMNSVKSVIETMRELDSKGGYESDDEVGSVFKSLLEIVETLDYGDSSND